MAAPAGLRPIWHTLKRTRIPTPTLLHSSRSFASQKEPQDESPANEKSKNEEPKDKIQQRSAPVWQMYSGRTMLDDEVYERKEDVEKNHDPEKPGLEITRLQSLSGTSPYLGGLHFIPPKTEAWDNLWSGAEPELDPETGKPKKPELDPETGKPKKSKYLPRSVLENTPGLGASYPEIDPDLPDVRFPRSVQAVYLRPLRRQAQYGVPTCDLQLRSYSVRSLEFFADFALRAAYYLHLPAYGPVPLPRITQRWTVPKSHFIFKKSQENFERVTVRRLIQIKDGSPESMELWLAFLRKHQYHGVGMKANVWEYEKIGVGKEMDVKLGKVADQLKPDWGKFGRKHNVQTADKVMELMNSEKFRQVAGHPAS